MPATASGNDLETSEAAIAASVRDAPTSSTIRPAQRASSSAKPPDPARAEDERVLPALPHRGGDGAEVEQRSDQHGLAGRGGGDDRPRSVRRREDQRLAARLRELGRRVAEVELAEVPAAALPRGDRAGQFGLQPERLVDLDGAEHALVAGGERLDDRRRRAHDVDHDPDRSLARLGGRERDIHTHAATLPRPRCPTAIATRTARPGSRARNAGGPSATSA